MMAYLRKNWKALCAFPAFLAVMGIATLAIAPFAHSTPTTPEKGIGSTITITTPVPDSQKVADSHNGPYLFFMRECGDTETLPCVTVEDNGDWRIVTGYAPNYSYVALVKCKNEDGGPILPCVYVSKNDSDLSPFYVWMDSLSFN